MTMASEAQKEWMRQYHIKNKEKRLAYKKEQYQKTKEQHLAKCSEYHKENAESIKERKRQQYNPTQRKAQMLKKYNLTLEDFNSMYNEQEGCCKICGEHSSKFKKGLAVDHNHVTGAVRGLLCGICNTGLAVYEEHRNKLEEYLSSYERQ